MPLELSPETGVTRDDEGRVVELDHSMRPVGVRVDSREPATAREAAGAYVREAAPIFGFTPEEVGHLDDPPRSEPIDAGSRLRFEEEREIAGLGVIHYVQTGLGLPVWNTGLTVRVNTRSLQVVGASRQTLDGLAPRLPNLEEAPYAPRNLNLDRLVEALDTGLLSAPPKVHGASLLIYRFDPANREHEELEIPEASAPSGALPGIPLRPLDLEGFPPGSDRVVTHALFAAAPPEGVEVNWRAFLDPETGAILYLRPLTSAVNGCVFRTDPASQGCNDCSAETSTATLNAYRSCEPLLGLTAPPAGADQELRGEYVEIRDFECPKIAAPTQPVGSDFLYDATSDEFSAVSAYYHCDSIFRTIRDLGFDPASYFSGTSFPVPVDFRGAQGTVNAWCDGNPEGRGTGGFRFGLMESAWPMGIATDPRVVWHEFGHALLWDHVRSPNFGFAHSPGDSLAAIHADPGSQAKKPGKTFPFAGASGTWSRSHDRGVCEWAWFGHQWNKQYNGEQILSTTLFRAYRSIGGGSPDAGHRELASRYMLYLIVKGCGLLTCTTEDPRVLVNALLQADRSTLELQGEAGGTASKVLRWSFEKQGLFQSPDVSRPYTRPGLPPEVDLFIDDGRRGQYDWPKDWEASPGVWNRHAADGLETNQAPLPGQTNSLYARLENRGTSAATGATVRAFARRPGSAGDWPDDWQAFQGPGLAVGGSIPPGGQALVGPFDWVPTAQAGESVLVIVSAPADPAVVDNPQIQGGRIPNWRLVPCDNNIAQRTF